MNSQTKKFKRCWREVSSYWIKYQVIKYQWIQHLSQSSFNLNLHSNKHNLQVLISNYPFLQLSLLCNLRLHKINWRFILLTLPVRKVIEIFSRLLIFLLNAEDSSSTQVKRKQLNKINGRIFLKKNCRERIKQWPLAIYLGTQESTNRKKHRISTLLESIKSFLKMHLSTLATKSLTVKFNFSSKVQPSSASINFFRRYSDRVTMLQWIDSSWANWCQDAIPKPKRFYKNTVMYWLVNRQIRTHLSSTSSQLLNTSTHMEKFLGKKMAIFLISYVPFLIWIRMVL